MPQFDTSTPTISRKFADHTFTVPAPFAEGHALTANEATFLNGQVASVVGNQFAGDIRRALAAYNKAQREALPKKEQASYVDTTDVSVLGWDMAARFAAKYAEYELGVSNRGGDGSGSANDALTRTVNFLNAEDMKARIIAKGLKVGAFQKAAASDPQYKTKWAELLAKNLEAKGDQFRATAQAQIDAAAANAGSDDLLDGITTPEVEAQPEAA